MTKELTINALPSKTWHFLNVNDAKLTWDEDNTVSLSEEKYIVPAGNRDAVVRYDITGELTNVNGEYINKDIYIEANEGSNSVIYMNSVADGRLRYTTNVVAKKGAVVKIVQLPFSNKGAVNYNVINGHCEDNGRIEIVQVYLGCGDTYSDIKIDLNGDESSLKIDIGYLGIEDRNIDINVVANHYGKKTETEINTSGTLDDSSKKTFRGTIDFKKGCTDSIGNEKESVLLLGDDIVNKTVPLILCAEENVVGNHGATIGELDDDTLFYFESRGIDAKTAKNIMARASIESLLKFIDDDNMKTLVTDTLKEEL